MWLLLKVGAYRCLRVGGWLLALVVPAFCSRYDTHLIVKLHCPPGLSDAAASLVLIHSSRPLFVAIVCCLLPFLSSHAFSVICLSSWTRKALCLHRACHSSVSVCFWCVASRCDAGNEKDADVLFSCVAGCFSFNILCLWAC